MEVDIFRRLLIALLALLAVFVVGTASYRILGGPEYSLLDCFYMTFIAVTTIGFSEVVDVTQYEYGRLFTVIIAITGIGVLGYVLSTLTAYILEGEFDEVRRRKKMEHRIAQLNGHYIICGVGLVGSNVAHDLSLSGQPLIIVDNDMSAIQHYLETHPAQLYVHGDVTDNDVLLAAGVLRAKGIFAVAHEDSANLVISLSAKQLNPALRVVARCHNMRNAEKTLRAGADEVVSPDFSGGLRIVSAMIRPNVLNFLDEMLKPDSKLHMDEILVPGNLADKLLSDLYRVNPDIMVLAVRRQGAWQFNPTPALQMQSGDVLMVMTTPEGRRDILRLVET
jgi:voltage-gated potassium channel